MKGVHIIPFGLFAFTWIASALGLPVLNASRYLLCTLEDKALSVADNGLVDEALALLSWEGQQVDSEKYFIQPEKVWELVSEPPNTTEARWSRCQAFLIRAQCNIASTITDWLLPLTMDAATKRRIVISEPNFLPCQIMIKEVLQLARPNTIIASFAKVLLHGQLKWRYVILIHDIVISTALTSKLRLAMSDYSMLVQVREIQDIHRDRTLVHKYLSELNAASELKFILILSKRHLFEVLHLAKVLNLLQPHHYWIVLTTTSCDEILGNVVPPESNVLLVEVTFAIPSEPLPPHCPGHKMDDTAAFTLDRKVYLLATGISITLGSISTRQTTAGGLSVCDTQQHLPTGSIERTELPLIAPEGNVAFDLSSGLVSSSGLKVWSTDKYSMKNYTEIATWSNACGLKVLQGPVFRNHFVDFRNHRESLIVSTKEAAPFVMRAKTENGTKYEGFCIDILDVLATRLHFSYTIVEVKDQKWGSKDDSGRWNGVVGEVSRLKAQIGVGPLSLTSEREQVVDYTSPFAEEGTSFMVLKPGVDLAKSTVQMFRPFQPLVWLFLCVMFLMMTAAVFLLERSSPFSGQRRKLSESVWAMYGYALGQGTAFKVNSASARLTVGVFCLVLIIITSSYTAELAAVLTVDTEEEPFNSIGELASQSGILPLIEQGSNLDILFNTARTGVYRDIAKMMTKMPEVTDPVEARKLVETGKWAYISDKSQIDYLVLTECDKYVLSKTVFNTGTLGFVVPKGAPYLEAFNDIIVKLLESGILTEWRRKWWSHDGLFCTQQARFTTAKHLDVIYLLGPCFVFIGAAGLGCLLAGANWVWKREGFQALVAHCRLKQRSCKTLSRQSISTNPNATYDIVS